MTVADCHVIELPKVADSRGNLTFIESGRHIPFEIRRVFYLYDVPGGESRAGHALKHCHQFLVAMSGSFDVVLDDGVERRRVHLCRSYNGVHVPPMIWRELDNFSFGSVCVAFATFFDAQDYYRDYDEFARAIRGQRG
jgi:hypothetical protein